MASLLGLHQRLAVLGSGYSCVAPVIGIDFLDHDVRQVRILVEHRLHGFGDLGDDLGFLFFGNAVAGDTNADERHGRVSSSRLIGMRRRQVE